MYNLMCMKVPISGCSLVPHMSTTKETKPKSVQIVAPLNAQTLMLSRGAASCFQSETLESLTIRGPQSKRRGPVVVAGPSSIQRHSSAGKHVGHLSLHLSGAQNQTNMIDTEKV